MVSFKAERLHRNPPGDSRRHDDIRDQRGVLGNPAAFDWSIGSECDPVAIPEETNKTTLVVDYAPEQGYASWPPPQP